MTVPTLVKTRRRNARVAGILLKLETWRHWDFLSETPPLSARLSWAERKDALIWRGPLKKYDGDGRKRFVDELAGRMSEGIDVARVDSVSSSLLSLLPSSLSSLLSLSRVLFLSLSGSLCLSFSLS